MYAFLKNVVWKGQSLLQSLAMQCWAWARNVLCSGHKLRTFFVSDIFLCHRSQTSRCYSSAWWRHQMETFSALLALCAGNSPVPGEFHAQRPVTRSFDVFFDLGLYQQLSKQWGRRWFETQSRSLWRQCNGEPSAATIVSDVKYDISALNSLILLSMLWNVKDLCR